MNDRTKEIKELMDDAEQIVIEAPSAQPRTLLKVNIPEPVVAPEQPVPR